MRILYMPGFRLDPAEQLARVHQELASLHRVHSADPILGVEFQEEENVSLSMPKQTKRDRHDHSTLVPTINNGGGQLMLQRALGIL